MWRYAAAKATGRSHERAGLPCQDWFACAEVGLDGIVLALADGAGSAVLGERGAEVAVATIQRVVCDSIHNGDLDLVSLLLGAVSAARHAVTELAAELQADPRDLACTLLAVVIRPSGGAAAHIGDGAIVVRDRADSWCWVFWPQHGEFVNTTRFLTDGDAMEHIQLEALGPNVADLVLFSDGLEHLALNFSDKQPHEPFFNGVVQPLLSMTGTGELSSLSAQLECFLRSSRVVDRTDDDVTLILATRRPHAERNECPSIS